MDESENGMGEGQDGAGNLQDDAGKKTDNAAEGNAQANDISIDQQDGKKAKHKKERKKAEPAQEQAQEHADESQPSDTLAAAATAEGKENQSTTEETDAGKAPKPKKPRKMANIKFGKKEVKIPVRRIVWSSVALVLVVLLVLGGVFLYPIFFDPMAAFNNTPPQASVTPSPSDEDNTGDDTSDEDLPPPTPDPLDLLGQKADKEISSKDILNVALIGYDHAEERENWKFKYFYSDVMIVLAINFKENKVDMISCPRDTYSPIYNRKGKYKLNSSFYWGVKADGGDYENPEDRKKGYEYVCKSMQTVIGGDKVPPIDYYIAVDMPAVKTLVDKIGGVDFNIEMPFTMQGRSYTPGPIHMSGQAALDYFRVRKHIEESGDLNRVDRQKDLLVAIFSQIKGNRKLIDLPDLLTSLSGQVDTNMNLQQLCALAKFGMGLDEKNIAMEAMPGKYAYWLYNWNYVILNAGQRNRLIQQVYGIDAKDIEQHTSYYNYEYVNRDWYTKVGNNSISIVQRKLAADAALPPEQQKFVEPILSAINAKISALQSAINTRNWNTIKDADEKFQKEIDAIFGPLGIHIKKNNGSDLWQYELKNSQDQLSG